MRGRQSCDGAAKCRERVAAKATEKHGAQIRAAKGDAGNILQLEAVVIHQHGTRQRVLLKCGIEAIKVNCIAIFKDRFWRPFGSIELRGCCRR